MSKIELYILGKDGLNFNDFYYEIQNRLISYEHNKFYFNSKFGPKEEIILDPIELKFDETILEKIREILKIASNQASEISSENMDMDYLKLNQGIISTINMFSYLDLSELSIFDFFLEIFVKLLIGHYLTNGNKRMALTFLKGIMWEFGYYLKFTEGVWKNYNKHRTVIEEFAMGLETRGNDELQTRTKKDIKSWIIKNAIIGLNWRR